LKVEFLSASLLDLPLPLGRGKKAGREGEGGVAQWEGCTAPCRCRALAAGERPSRHHKTLCYMYIHATTSRQARNHCSACCHPHVKEHHGQPPQRAKHSRLQQLYILPTSPPASMTTAWPFLHCCGQGHPPSIWLRGTSVLMFHPLLILAPARPHRRTRTPTSAITNSASAAAAPMHDHHTHDRESLGQAAPPRRHC